MFLFIEEQAKSASDYQVVVILIEIGHDLIFQLAFGNTPTGVGKTSVDSGRQMRYQKHPHGRGEDCKSSFIF